MEKSGDLNNITSGWVKKRKKRSKRNKRKSSIRLYILSILSM